MHFTEQIKHRLCVNQFKASTTPMAPSGIITFTDWSVKVPLSPSLRAKIVFKYFTKVQDLMVNIFVKGKVSDHDILLIDKALKPRLDRIDFFF